MDSLSDRVFVATFTTELEKNVSRIRQQNSVMAVGGGLGNKISESVARGPERDGMRLHKIMSMCTRRDLYALAARACLDLLRVRVLELQVDSARSLGRRAPGVSHGRHSRSDSNTTE